jgi:predicted nucleotidyltransferase
MDSDEKKRRRKAAGGGWPKLWNLPRNWAHQGLSYMDPTERWTRLALEAGEVALLAVAVAKAAGLPMWDGRVLLAGFAVAHTANWVFNGNFWALLLFTFANRRNRGEALTCAYLNRMAERLRSSRAIAGLALYGSVSRGQWHDRSDIDLRLLRRPGPANALMAGLLIARERFLAFAARQPVDMYLGDDLAFLKRMRDDEAPVFLVKRDERLEIAFPGRPEVTLTRLHASAAAPASTRREAVAQ